MLGEKGVEVPTSEYLGSATTPLQNEIEKLKLKLMKEREKMSEMVNMKFTREDERLRPEVQKK